jgi:hypothetical protein
VGTGGVKWHAKILAKGSKLEVRRGWFVLVLLEIPHRSLERAEDVIASRKEDVKPFIPGLKKGAVEGGVVSDKLGDEVGSSIGGEHWSSCMAAKEVREARCDLLGFMGLPGPEAAVVVVFAKAIAVGLTFVEAKLCFKSLYGFKVAIDGYCGKLNDRMPLGV